MVTTMTPKEKAKELTNKYFKGSDLLYHDLSWIQAKECALILVDEILQIKSVDKDYDLSEFWQEVKEEIEIL